jgi:hypothetical protein
MKEVEETTRIQDAQREEKKDTVDPLAKLKRLRRGGWVHV